MSGIAYLTLEVDDPTAAEAFYAEAFDLGDAVRVRQAEAESAKHDDLVVLLGVEDVKASKAFYVEQGLAAGKSFGGKYAELETGPTVKLSLYPRKAAAKDAGVPETGSGSHRIVLTGSVGPVTDPDGYVWEADGNE